MARLMLNQLLETNAGQYDLIIGDAFNDLSIPYHLTTREFDLGLRRLLKDDGYYLALVIDKLRGGRFMPAYTETVRTRVAVRRGPGRQPSTGTAPPPAPTSSPPATSRSMKRASPPPRARASTVAVTTEIMPANQMAAWLENARAPVLTDDYAPVDNLIAPVFAERGFSSRGCVRGALRCSWPRVRWLR